MRSAQKQLACDPQLAAEFLRALAHPMRLRILCRLLEGELAVAGFESELGLKQPSLSQQLALLRDAGLVSTRREAKSIFYTLADDKVRVLLDALREAFSVAPAIERKRAKITKASVLAPSRGRAPPPARTPTRRPHAGECGVFSVAGWDLDWRS